MQKEVSLVIAPWKQSNTCNNINQLKATFFK